MKIGGDVYLDQEFTAEGAIRLPASHVIGQLVCSEAKINGSDNEGDSLIADELKAADIFLDEEFIAKGAIRLPATHVTGKLVCSGAKINGTDSLGSSLIADQIRIDSITLDHSFSSVGAVRLSGATINGQLSLSGASIGPDSLGNALVGDGMKIGVGLSLDKEFTAEGAIRIPATHVTGQLVCSGAKINGSDNEGDSLIADGLKVGGDVFLNEGFSTVGTLRLNQARIEGSLFFEPAELSRNDALLAAGMHVTHALHWRPQSQVSGLVDLERASVPRLVDHWPPRITAITRLLDWLCTNLCFLATPPDRPGPPWPTDIGKLRIVKFGYQELGGNSPGVWKQRRDWIRLNHTPAENGRPAYFAAQPYEQLRLAYRQAGQDRYARNIAISSRNDLRKYGNLNFFQWVANWILDKTVKHGYRPQRALLLLAVVYLAAFLTLSWAQDRNGLIVPAKPIPQGQSKPVSSKCDRSYACFYPAGYAVDVVVPIINVHQSENWRINGSAPWGNELIYGTWFATGFGYLFATLAIAGSTGLIRKE
jgi:hypothetical protein